MLSQMDMNSIETDEYFIELCEQVFSNPLILSKIFTHLSLRELYKSCLVCIKWQIEAKRVIVNRSESLNVYHLFRTENRSEVWENADNSRRTDEELEYCDNWIDRYDFKTNFIKCLKNELQSVPEVCLLVYGSFGEDVRLKQRLHQTEEIRKSLPAANYRVVNLNSQCLIGFPTTSSIPVEKISHFGDLAAVSMLLLPRYRSDTRITVFSGADMREKIFKLPNIKSIVLFTTSSIFQDNRNLYLDINTLSKFISQTLHNRVAFGGYNSAYFSFNKKDFLNYTDTQPSDGSEDFPLIAHELIGLCFSGNDLKANSLTLNSKRLPKIINKLREFKNNLEFKALNNHFYETIVFMFTDEEKNDAFTKLTAFRTVFPASKVLGISGYGQYGFNYWPSLDNTDSTDFKTKSFSKFVANKSKPSKPKRKIVLNTNMTTFVVIKMPKKLI